MGRYEETSFSISLAKGFRAKMLNPSSIKRRDTPGSLYESRYVFCHLGVILCHEEIMARKNEINGRGSCA